MSRPLREVTTYLVIAFSIAIGLAVAMPHAGINVLLSAFAPITAVLIITFTATPRGRRRELWASVRAERAPASSCGRSPCSSPCSWRAVPTPSPSSWASPTCVSFDITALRCCRPGP